MGAVIDFQDATKAHLATLERAKELSQVANEWEEPLPLPSLSLPPFPIQVLPQWLRWYVEAIANSTQTPIDLAGCLALAVLSVALTKKADVQIRERWEVPLNLYLLVAMESGTGKSPAFRAMMRPVFALQRELNAAREHEREQVKQERDLLQRRQEQAKQDAVRAKDPQRRKEAESEIEDLTEKLLACPLPYPVALTTGDVTPERLAVLLEENEERIGILDSEGGIFETLAGRYSDKVPNLDLVLKALDGDFVRIDRKNALPLCLTEPLLTIGLTVQPFVLRSLAQKEGFRERGLLPRFLYSFPVTNVGYRTFQTEGFSPSIEDVYTENVQALLRLPVAKIPYRLAFSLSAYRRFETFWQEVETRLRPDNPLHSLTEWGNKYRGMVARLCGLLHIADTASLDKQVIPLETLERAICLGEYFQAHAIGVFSEMGLSGASEACRLVLGWLGRTKAETFTKRELHKALESRFPRADLLIEPLTLLEERGYIRKQEALVKRAGRPSEVYEVNPKAHFPKQVEEGTV